MFAEDNGSEVIILLVTSNVIEEVSDKTTVLSGNVDSNVVCPFVGKIVFSKVLGPDGVITASVTLWGSLVADVSSEVEVIFDDVYIVFVVDSLIVTVVSVVSVIWFRLVFIASVDMSVSWVKLDWSCEKVVVEDENSVNLEISFVNISLVAVTVFLVYGMTVVSVDVDVVPVCNDGFIDAKSEE